MALTLSGIFSGMDTNSIVSQLMAIEQRPVALLQQRKQVQATKMSAITDLESRFNTLKDALDKMRDASTLRAVNSSSSDTSILGISTTTGASEGSHTIEIHQLATAQRRIQTVGLAATTSSVGSAKSSALNTNGVADADAAWFTTSANGATYTFDFGTQAALDSVTFAANTGYSLNQVVALINARSQALAGYNAASVVSNNGTYSLKLTAKDNGPVGVMTQTLTAGDAIAQLNNDADWTKTDGAAGTFSYTYKGVTRTLNTSAGTTLQNLRDLINNDGSNPGVTASLLQYNNAYHLVLSANDTGADHTITINDAQTTLAGFASADIAQTQQAKNAQIRIDGFPSSDWIERDSNTVTDVIDNATLTLQDTGTATASITRNTDDLKNSLNNLVAVYNGLLTKIGTYTGYNTATKTGGVLQGDSTIVTIMAQLRSNLTFTPAGFASGQDAFVLPDQIGLSFDKKGQMSLDATKLDSALSSNYLGVLALIGARNTGTSSSTTIQFSSAADTTAAGIYDTEVDYRADGSISTARVRKQGADMWEYLDISGNELIGPAGSSIAGLVLTSSNDGTSGAHTQTATVNIRRGLAGVDYSLLDQALDTTTGVIAIQKNGITTTSDNLQKQIDDASARLAKQEARLKAQFARLESALASMDVQRAAYQSFVQNTNTSGVSNSSNSSNSSSNG